MASFGLRLVGAGFHRGNRAARFFRVMLSQWGLASCLRCAPQACLAIVHNVTCYFVCRRDVGKTALRRPLCAPQARMEILKIHASKITKHGDIDYEAAVKLAEGFNGADLRNICTEAGMFAIRWAGARSSSM